MASQQLRTGYPLTDKRKDQAQDRAKRAMTADAWIMAICGLILLYAAYDSIRVIEGAM